MQWWSLSLHAAHAVSGPVRNIQHAYTGIYCGTILHAFVALFPAPPPLALGTRLLLLCVLLQDMQAHVYGCAVMTCVVISI